MPILSVEKDFKVKNGLIVTNTLTVLSSVQSTSTTTGAINVIGGVGIGGDLWLGGTLYGRATGYDVNTRGQTNSGTYFLTLVDSNNTTTTAELVYTTSTLQIDLGTKTLSVNNASIGGTLNVSSLTTLSSSTTINGLLTVNNSSTITGSLSISGTTNSTSTQTGALIITGGIGVGKDVNIGGALTVSGSSGVNITGLAGLTTTNLSVTNTSIINTLIVNNTSTFNGQITATNIVRISNTTSATSSLTGALQVSGGVGIIGDVYIGGLTTGIFTGSFYGSFSGNASNADKWTNARTISLSGDLDGSVSIDGTSNVTLTATVAANSIALGTDTTGSYIATGATSGYGISGSSSTEGGIFTVTSNATSSNIVSTLVYRDESGNFSATNITASLLGNATSADKWTNARTLTLAGDLTGSATFDGSSNFSLTATIAADSVALGTDTTGSYIATGATSGYGISGSSTTEGGIFTVTSNATSTNTVSTLVYRDESGNFFANIITATTFSGNLSGNSNSASNADKWTFARIITLSGDLGGNVSIDGSSNVILTATIQADSVALGADTTGIYVASAATSGFGISGSANTEGSSFTVSSNATSSNTTSTIVFRDGNGDFSAGGAVFSRPVTFGDNVTFSGSATFVYSTNTVYTDNIINVHTPPGGSSTTHTWSSDDGKDIGLIFHYYKTTDKDAFLGLANDTGYLEWYNNGNESGGVFTGTSYGTFKTSGIILVGTTSATSTTTGALTVAGGAGIGGNLYVGGNLIVSGGSISGNAASADKWANARTLTLAGDLTGSATFDGSSNFSLTATIAADSVALGTDTTGIYISTGATSGFGISGSANTEGSTFTVSSNATSSNTTSTIVFRDSSGNFSANIITASFSGNSTSADQIKTTSSTSNSTHYITFVDSNNASSTNEILLTTSTITINPGTGSLGILGTSISTSTQTGALQVTGGVGIGGDLYQSGLHYAGQSIIAGRYLSSPFPIIAPSNIINKGTGLLAEIGTAVTVGTNPSLITTDPTGRWLYVAHYGAATIGQYAINQTNGSLSSIASAIACGANPYGIIVDPKGLYLYVANFGSNTIGAYTINASTGALTLIGATVVGTAPYGVAVDPTGRFLYSSNSTSGTINQHTITAGSGALVSITSAISAGTTPYGLVVDPTGRWLYVANYGSNNVQLFSINQTSGALSNIATYSTGTQPFHVIIDPTGRFLYVTNYGSGNVSQFSINQTTGVLTSIGSAVACGTNPYAITDDPTGTFIYVANYGSNTLSQFSINQVSGALTSLGSTVGTAQNPYGVNADPTGRFVYAANYTAGTISQFSSNNFSAGQSVITSPVNASSTVTGALVVRGGVGIGLDLRVGGTIYGTVSGSITSAASADQVKTIEQTGNATYYLTFVDSNNPSGASETVYTTNLLRINPNTQIISFLGTTNATSTNTGALQVAGGAGINGDIWAKSGIFTNNLDLRDNTTSSIVLASLQQQGSTVVWEFGRTDQSNTPAIDFHSSGFNIDYDARIQAIGGTSTVGQARLDILASQVLIGTGTVATSTITGALRVIGGAGIGQNLWVGGTINGSLSGNATSADQIKTISQSNSATYYPIFVDSNNATATAESVYSTSSFIINPSTKQVGIGLINTNSMLTVNGRIESVTDAASEGGQIVLRGKNSYRWNLDNYQDRFRIFREDDVTEANGNEVLTITSSTLAVMIGASTQYSGEKFGVNGSAYINGIFTATEIRSTGEITAYYTSDKRLKENLKLISNPIALIDKIHGYYFDWKEDYLEKRGGEDGYFIRKNDVGVIAQEIEKILPQIVATRDDGFKALRYEKLIPLLIEAVKDQQEQIKQLDIKINNLINKLNNEN